MNHRFRLATVADAAALSAFGARTFTDWYTAGNDPEHVRAHVEATYSVPLQAAELAVPGQWALMAEQAGAIAAYGMVLENEPCPGQDRTGLANIKRFYVDRPWHGSGLAVALMKALTATGKAAGIAGFWLTCWEENPRALAFYAKCGFRDVGETIFMVGTDPQRDRLLLLEV